MTLPLLSLASSLLIVASDATNEAPGWRRVIDALTQKHADANVRTAFADSVTNTLPAIRSVRPRYLAFVMRPDEIDEPTVRTLHEIVRTVDDDPFDDAIWGIVTGPTPQDALRLAESRGPATFERALATTGLDLDLVPGAVTMLSDANPPGVWKEKKHGIANGSNREWQVEEHRETGDMSHAFVFGWNDDPDLILTSSHATERNLEMPFSRGNLFPTNGYFAATCGLPLAAPKREKIWIAAGNCLIANNRYAPANMIMTSLGWGKVNQFVGYTVETWYGEIGWNTWRYFHAYRLPLNLAWYAANQNLMRTRTSAKPGSHDRKGKDWDMDGTVFYGDPMLALSLPATDSPPKWTPDALPLLIVHDRDEPNARKPVPPGWKAFEADDFTLVTEWL